MRFFTIRQEEQFLSLETAWNHLLQQGASHVPFLRHEYLAVWWRTLGGGEWPAGELRIVAAEDDAGRLAGIAPLFRTLNRDGLPALMLLGSIEISDYLDLIVPPAWLEDFLAGLLPHLAQDADWQRLDLYNLVDSSPTLPALDRIARAQGYQVERAPLQHCPFIPLPGDWETYLSQIDKKQRHEIRRKMRRVEAAEIPTRWYIVSDPAALEAEIEAFLQLMEQDDGKRGFLTPLMRLQMKAAMGAAFAAGWLQLAFLEAGGKKAAAYLNFDYDNHIWVYNSGLNFELRELSPGWVLLGYLLQWANENKRQSFDFMRGDEEYKYRFGAVDRRVERIQVIRP